MHNRKDYLLTEQAREAIGDHFKELADEFGSNPRYIYGVIYEENPDAYAFFRVWYAACVRAANVNHCVYDDDMAAIRNRYRKTCGACDSPKDFILNKVTTDALTTRKAIEAFADESLTQPERVSLRQCAEQMKANADALLRLIEQHTGALDINQLNHESARGAN